MPRTARSIEAGMVCHVLNRGNGRMRIFHKIVGQGPPCLLSFDIYPRKGRREPALLAFGEHKVPAPIVDGKVKLRALVDRTSLELFANDGAAVATCYAFPDSNDRAISISARPDLKIDALVVHELKSAWAPAKKTEPEP